MRGVGIGPESSEDSDIYNLYRIANRFEDQMERR